MSRTGKLLLGIATLALLTSTVYIDVSFFLGRISLIADPNTPSRMSLAMTLFVVNAMLSYGLMAFYLVHILLRRDLSRAGKWIWFILVVMLNLLAMTVFYIFRILPRTESDTASPGLSSA